MRDLVADDNADAPVVKGLGEGRMVEGRLQDARGEHCRREGKDFSLVDGFAFFIVVVLSVYVRVRMIVVVMIRIALLVIRNEHSYQQLQ